MHCKKSAFHFPTKEGKADYQHYYIRTITTTYLSIKKAKQKYCQKSVNYVIRMLSLR